MGGFEAR